MTKTVGVVHSRRYCNTGYDRPQGRRPSTLKCIGSIYIRRYIEPNHPSEINPNSDSRSRSDGRSRRHCNNTGYRPVSRTETKMTTSQPMSINQTNQFDGKYVGSYSFQVKLYMFDWCSFKLSSNVT